MALQTKGEGWGVPLPAWHGLLACSWQHSLHLPQAPDKPNVPTSDHRFVGRFWVAGEARPLPSGEEEGLKADRPEL